MDYPISCYNTDKFAILEEKLYKEKRELKHKIVCFMVNGTSINDTTLTLEKCKIKDNDIILIYSG